MYNGMRESEREYDKTDRQSGRPGQQSPQTFFSQVDRRGGGRGAALSVTEPNSHPTHSINKAAII